MELTILMPCLDEAETVSICVGKALAFIQQNGIEGEVLVADNGSTDGSIALARNAGARVINVLHKGYGSALRAGIAAARGRFVIMGDADDSYDFTRLSNFLDKLRFGQQLVMGDRFAGGIAVNAMPPLHRYLGNPVLSFIGRLFFKSPVHDFHCGLRGFDRTAITKLKLSSPGMEFASELIVKATLAGLRISEVPTTLSPAGRSRAPHLRSWRDGWRHLKLLMLYSPRWLFLYPGTLLLMIGLSLQLALSTGPLKFSGIALDVHTMLYASAATIVGLQTCLLSLLASFYGVQAGLFPANPRSIGATGKITLERALILGLVLIAGGLTCAWHSVSLWIDSGLGELDPRRMMRMAIPSMTMIVCGGQLVMSGFFWALLHAKNAPDDEANIEYYEIAEECSKISIGVPDAFYGPTSIDR